MIVQPYLGLRRQRRDGTWWMCVHPQCSATGSRWMKLHRTQAGTFIAPYPVGYATFSDSGWDYSPQKIEIRI